MNLNMMNENTLLSVSIIENLYQKLSFHSKLYNDSVEKEMLSKAIIYTNHFESKRSIRDFLIFLQTTDFSCKTIQSDFDKYIQSEYEEFKQLTKTLNEVGYFMEGHNAFSFIGRKDELDLLGISLNRRIKNNVIIVGEPGVGKTALVKEYRHLNKEKDIFVVEFNRAMTNTKYRGEFENKLTNLLDFIKKYHVLLFIDEIHILLNAGKVEGGLSGGDILKTYITDPDIQIIGATTNKEFELFKLDRALERRFNIIKLAEIDNRTLKEVYVKIIDDLDIVGLKDSDFIVIKEILDLQENRYYPDKLIDFLDFYKSVEEYLGKCTLEDVLNKGGYNEQR